MENCFHGQLSTFHFADGRILQRFTDAMNLKKELEGTGLYIYMHFLKLSRVALLHPLKDSPQKGFPRRRWPCVAIGLHSGLELWLAMLRHEILLKQGLS